MTKKPGEISASGAARYLGCDDSKVYGWIDRKIAGGPTPLTYLRVSLSGRKYLSYENIRQIKRDGEVVFGTLESSRAAGLRRS